MADEITAAVQRDINEIRRTLAELARDQREAESEVPEKMRRFMQYMHGVHDIRNMYVEQGLDVPPLINSELERLDDRFRHLLEDMNASGAAFDKVRREMGMREGNRWDHTKQLKGPSDETRNGSEPNGGDQG